MTASEIDADFTACDTTVLSRFFADYLRTHTQGGTNTLQRNLARGFAFLDEVYDHPSPYTARLNRTARWRTTSPIRRDRRGATSRASSRRTERARRTS
jgi:hypothetical protein